MTVKECRDFLEKCSELAFRDPEAGHRYAIKGLARVERLGNPPELYARALVLMGSSLRPFDPWEAVTFVERALGIYREQGTKATPHQRLLQDEADARRRVALIYMDLAALGQEGHQDKAFDEVDRAYKLCVALRDGESAARCQSSRATILIRLEKVVSALRVLLPALPKLQGIDSIGAAHNIRTALLWARRRGISIPENLRRLALTRSIRLVRLAPSSRERWVDRPSSGSYGRRKKTPEDALWRWNLAIFLLEERRYRDALRVLQTARDDLADLSMPLYTAEIVLDIAPLYARFGMWEEVQQISAETIELLSGFPGSAQAMAAYGLWAEAIEAEDQGRLKRLTMACYAALGKIRSEA